MKSILTDVTCTLLPGKYAHGDRVPELYNEAYRYWRKTWGEIFTKAGSPASLNTENFLRQNIVICLHQGNRIVGMLTQTFFNIRADATYDHAYLQPFPQHLIKALRASSGGFVTTAEYLSVHSDFRRSIIGVSLSEVLLGILSRVFTESEGRMLLATTVRPARVHESCAKFGWQEVGVVQKYGLDCILMHSDLRTTCTHPDRAVASLIDDYWAQRQDWTGLTVEEQPIIRRAA